MRKALKTELQTLYPVYALTSTAIKSQKPYMILKFGTPISTNLGSFTMFTITAYAKPGDTDTLDTMCEAIIKKINRVRIARNSDGSFFVPEFVGESDDFPDTALSALGKPLSFRVPRFGKDYM
jgi:hypothetical protein